MRNGTVLGQKLTRSALPYQVTNTGFLSLSSISGGRRFRFTTITPSGRPRVLTIKDLNAAKTLADSSARMKNTGFSPRLFANSGGFYVFALSRSGSLMRLTTFRNRTGRFSFGDPHLAQKNLGGLRTLSFYNRQSVNGVSSDILYATTKTGALKQIRVPVKRPGHTRVLTIKRSGFASYTGLSLGRCNSNTSKAYILGIDAPGNLARYYVLTGQANPSAGNLSSKGRAGTAFSWRLHATL
jgi:hypothetical protein